MCIKWGKFNSIYFKVLNGVLQRGVLSPKLFAIYIDDLFQDLAMCKSGCYINEQCMNDILYMRRHLSFSTKCQWPATDVACVF